MNNSLLLNNYKDQDNMLRYSHCEIHASLIMGILGFTYSFCKYKSSAKKCI